jgi:indole-3-glycerol phosphate synthase
MAFLDDILASTRERIAATRAAVSQEEVDDMVTAAAPALDFVAALRSGGAEPAIVAEIKRATPSSGDLDAGVDVAARAAAYRDGGAAALSILTEPRWFKGVIGDIHAARPIGLPILQKDFILDPFQVIESRAVGADALLLIVRILAPGALRGLLQLCHQVGMEALVEIYDESDLEVALEVGARVIGINQRDLETFEVDRDRTAKLAPSIPDGITIVSLSGVESRADVVAAKDAGAHAVLVGTTLMRASDPASALRELRAS